MKLDLDDLRGFVAIAELGSFHAAADSLHLSQPALTRRLQKLEATLGVQLIDRDSRQLRLSSVGRDFFFKAKRLLDELDAAVLGIRELADQASGEVTIGAVPTATYYFLPRVIEDFNTQYPRIRIRILDLSANDVLEAVQRGQAEFGINLLGAQEPDIDFEPLLRDPFLFVCRHDHALAQPRAGALGGHRALPVHHGRPAQRQPDDPGRGTGRTTDPAALVLRGAASEHVPGSWSRPGSAWPRCPSWPHPAARTPYSPCGRWSIRW